MKSLFAVALTMLISATAAVASPSEASRYLINEPVSMLTYGINGLQHFLEANASLKSQVAVSVKYDYQADRIAIDLVCMDCGLDPTELACAAVIEKIRLAAFLKDGKPLFKSGSAFQQFFDQAGYLVKSRPKDLATDLDRMFKLEVQIIGSPPGSPKSAESKLFMCEAPLLGNGYSVKRD